MLLDPSSSYESRTCDVAHHSIQQISSQRHTYGCMVSILSAFRKPAGVPSAVPMLQIVDGLLTVDLNEMELVLPELTFT